MFSTQSPGYHLAKLCRLQLHDLGLIPGRTVILSFSVADLQVGPVTALRGTRHVLSGPCFYR
jgi:hypothetical protein